MPIIVQIPKSGVEWTALSVVFAIFVFLWNVAAQRRARRGAGRVLAAVIELELQTVERLAADVRNYVATKAYVSSGSITGQRNDAFLERGRDALDLPMMCRDASQLSQLPHQLTQALADCLGHMTSLKSAIDLMVLSDVALGFDAGDRPSPAVAAKRMLKACADLSDSASLAKEWATAVRTGEAGTISDHLSRLDQWWWENRPSWL
ncbi:hypothetical protein A11M_0101650 [Xanthomonas vasicola pv. vasculorum NCPPB 895]|uniref:hypothetical protein n=1 Tax=Xanthomonas vasicola TaxID=56459 RepID=UPI0004D6A80A|nr:hypothetical protein [Xanthomonas vasicola]KEZ99321.1 hypothetical protein A11M_0101650 [Xanthomonas vasicola pv. vasculorum NCPPB 895]MBV7306394.1 hypothetical protein [Xanthomonas vasicola pv. vasculorum]MDO6935750.1 hypothetical protein [Xanthomonas vasicola]MDO6939634.1 hypothetical protein [Xanthomonas vasicola]